MSDDPTTRLYRVPLEEFTSERNALAASLKAAGDEAEARAVKALKKPSVPAWAVNQLAGRNPDEMRALLALRDRMDGASGEELRTIGEERRHLLAQLVRHADSILREAGYGASAATLEKVSQTLQAGASDEEVELLRTGRLTRELVPSGFEGLAWSDAARSAPPAPSKGRERAQAKAEQLAAAADEKEAEADKLAKAAAVARKHAEAAERQAEVAKRAAMRARERADAAVKELD